LDVSEFERALADGISRLGREAGGLNDVDQVSYATQANSFLLLGADDTPLTPIILWPDRRAVSGGEMERALCSLPHFVVATGVPAAGPEFMAAKLLWFQREEPRIWNQMRRVCLIDEYLVLLFTGQHVMEAGPAGLTGLVDIRRAAWWPEALSKMQLDLRALPAIARAGTDVGLLRPAAAAAFGLPPTCRFVVGSLDQYAGAIGRGNVSPEKVSETTGTVLATVRYTDHLAADKGPQVFQGPGPAPGHYYQMSFGNVSANYLEWYQRWLPDCPDFDSMTALAGGIEPGAGGLRLDTSHPPTVPEEVFEGLTSEHTSGHAIRCILEAVAWALRDQVLALCGGVPPAEVRAGGGGARSPLWLQIKADVLGVPLTPCQCPDAASLGAAILAETARTGASVAQIAQAWVKPGTPYLPNPQRHRYYQTVSQVAPDRRIASTASA
jgi:xylulokinase